MNLETIFAPLEAKKAGLVAIHGLTNELTETANVATTDELAEILNTVNPNHQYPPTNK